MSDVFLFAGEAASSDIRLRDPTGISASVTLSGVEAASAIGTVTVTAAASKTITGVSVTSAVGSVTVTAAASKTVAGVSSASAKGSVTVTANASKTVSGVASASAKGSVTVTAAASEVTTGVQALVAVGDVTIYQQQDASIELVGVEATASVGSAQPNIFVVLPQGASVKPGKHIFVVAPKPAVVMAFGVSARADVGYATIAATRPTAIIVGEAASPWTQALAEDAELMEMELV